MSENIAFRVDPKDINMREKKLLDCTITHLGRCGNIIERRKVGRRNEEISIKYDELIERNERGDYT